MNIDYLKTLFNLDPETGKLFWKRQLSNRVFIGEEAGTVCETHGYRFIGIDNVTYRAHHIVWALIHGEWTTDNLDHINRDRADNRAVNLRKADKSQNAMNSKTRIDNTSGQRGVSWDSGRWKWKAYINTNGKQIYLGRYDTKEEATQVYKNKAKELFGEFYAES